jgi:hypothetical protein
LNFGEKTALPLQAEAKFDVFVVEGGPDQVVEENGEGEGVQVFGVRFGFFFVFY